MEGDYISVDQSALTGESLPVNKKIEEEAYSGTIVKMGEMIGIVIQTGMNTFFGKTAKLVGYEHNFEERKILGDWAFEWGSYISVAAPKDGGEPSQSSGKLLRILKRQQNGEWKVARAIWNIDQQATSGSM